MPRSYDQRKEPGGPEMQKGARALRGPKRTGPIGTITPGDHVEVARDIQRLWLAIQDLKRRIHAGEDDFVQTIPVSISENTSGSQTLVANQAGKCVKIFSISLMAEAAVQFNFEQGGGADISGTYSFPDQGGFVKNYHPGGHYITAVGTSFDINLHSSLEVGGDLTYAYVDPE